VADERDVLTQAEQFLAQRQFPQVVELLSPWLPEHPEHARAWELLAAAHFELKEWPDAAEAAAQVVRLKPRSARSLCNWGTILRKAGRLQEAREALTRALAIAPGYTHALVELGKAAQAEHEGTPAPQRVVTDRGTAVPFVVCGRWVETSAGAAGRWALRMTVWCLNSLRARKGRPEHRRAAVWWVVSGCAVLVTVAVVVGISRRARASRLSSHSTGAVSQASPQAPPGAQPQVGEQAPALPQGFHYMTAEEASQQRAGIEAAETRWQAERVEQQRAEQQRAAEQPRRRVTSSGWNPAVVSPSDTTRETQPPPQAPTPVQQHGAAAQTSPDWCLLTVLSNLKGLSVLVVDADTGTTRSDVVGKIIGNPAEAMQAQHPQGLGPRFRNEAYLGNDAMAQLWVPTGVRLKVELSTDTVVIGLGKGGGAMKQQTISIPSGKTEYLLQMLF